LGSAISVRTISNHVENQMIYQSQTQVQL
jgi:hypothetical protein